MPLHERRIEVAPLAHDLIVFIKNEDRAYRHLEATAGSGDTMPRAGMGAAQHQLYRDRVIADVLVLEVKAQVGKSLKELRVKGAHRIAPFVAFVVEQEACSCAERPHDSLKVVGILDAKVLLHEFASCRASLVADRCHWTPPFFPMDAMSVEFFGVSGLTLKRTASRPTVYFRLQSEPQRGGDAVARLVSRLPRIKRSPGVVLSPPLLS